jgi:Ni/Fe-hydrogenase subunit HybB-like protein
MSTGAVALGGRIWTRPFTYLAALFGLGAVLIAWRFSVGLGASTALNDGYPWGLWIAFEVVTGTALACGGYAMALLVYIFNKGRYHPLVRPAILTSALGYTMAAVAIMIDVGRPWFIYRIPLRVWQWNLDSALLEVALCVMAYVGILWIELAPAFAEKGEQSGNPTIRSLAVKAGRILSKLYILIVAMGILLPTMHQSSLGTLMLLTGHKLHGLWFTPLVPLLFLISCIGMGYAVVVFEGALSSAAFKRKPETPMLAAVGGVVPFTLFLFLALRWIDLGVRGKLGLVASLDLYGVMFWVENLLFLAPALLLLNKQRRSDIGYLFRAAMLVILAGSLYRFDVYLVAFNPGPGWTYFPAVPELLISVGLVALEIMLFVFIVKKFPILAGTRPATSES